MYGNSVTNVTHPTPPSNDSATLPKAFTGRVGNT
jgi:hypothetical protein